MAETKSTCCYCGVGCGVVIEHEAGRITSVKGDPDHPANFGRLCTKGATLHLSSAQETLTARALYPELRATRDQARERVSWDTALDTAADRFAAIIAEHGPGAVAVYGAGQLLTEDFGNAVLFRPEADQAVVVDTPCPARACGASESQVGYSVHYEH